MSHNVCKPESHEFGWQRCLLYVHGRGARRAFGPGRPGLLERLRGAGQPVITGGSMGMGSWVLVGIGKSENRAFSSASHGAGRVMSRNQALRRWRSRELIVEFAARGIFIRTKSMRGAAEEAPGAYKDVHAVAGATERAQRARRVAFLTPRICVKG